MQNNIPQITSFPPSSNQPPQKKKSFEDWFFEDWPDIPRPHTLLKEYGIKGTFKNGGKKYKYRELNDDVREIIDMLWNNSKVTVYAYSTNGRTMDGNPMFNPRYIGKPNKRDYVLVELHGIQPVDTNLNVSDVLKSIQNRPIPVPAKILEGNKKYTYYFEIDYDGELVGMLFRIEWLDKVTINQPWTGYQDNKKRKDMGFGKKNKSEDYEEMDAGTALSSMQQNGGNLNVDDDTDLDTSDVQDNTMPACESAEPVEEAKSTDPFGWCKQDNTPGWQKALMVGIGVAAVGGIGFGIYKGVKYLKNRNSAPVDIDNESSNDCGDTAAALCAGLFGRR